jgi:predicted DNA binding CopG/RHH family protein
LDEFGKGELKPLNSRQREKYVSCAKKSLNKSQNINIRLSEADLLKLKAKVAQKGMPYQNLISSIIHQYGNR